MVVAPAGPAPASGRAVVGWGHPTTGAVARCAPSNGLDPFDLIEGLSQLLYAGYVVAAPDYPGLGVEGQSSYLIGVTEARSVLDAIRAARNLPDAGAGTDVLLWGHSQGGHAALFAAQSIDTYAPELRLHGVAVAAPATELSTLLDDHIADIDPDSPLNPQIGRDRGIPLSHSGLQLGCTTERIYDADELDK